MRGFGLQRQRPVADQLRIAAVLLRKIGRWMPQYALGEDGIRIPDFTIDDAESGICFYWEHCGMLGDAGYNKHWKQKKEVYAKHGIVEGDNLIVSEDSLSGGIDSAAIKALIDKYLS